MSDRSSGNSVRIEDWNVKPIKVGQKGTDKVTVEKIAVRDRDGKFHGATNFRGSILR
jgi:hypothetical protein